MFDLPEDDTLNDAFADMDFGYFFVINLGSLFLVMNLILLQFPIYYMARCCNGTWFGKKVQLYYADSQFWGTPIDFIKSAYVELCFACFINYLMFTTKGANSDSGVLVNNIYLVFASILVIGYPIWLYFLQISFPEEKILRPLVQINER
jgi:hypothetical protein